MWAGQLSAEVINGVLDHVLAFPNITWSVVAAQGVHRSHRNINHFVHAFRERLQKMPDQEHSHLHAKGRVGKVQISDVDFENLLEKSRGGYGEVSRHSNR